MVSLSNYLTPKYILKNLRAFGLYDSESNLDEHGNPRFTSGREEKPPNPETLSKKKSDLSQVWLILSRFTRQTTVYDNKLRFSFKLAILLYIICAFNVQRTLDISRK